ncbi:MAG: hypothetical protein ACKVVT_06010 [Dehalococcoidia bacterium]
MAAGGYDITRRPTPRWLRWLRGIALTLAIASILAATLAALHMTSEPRVDDPSHRDLVYFSIQGLALAGALVVGFVLGAILRTSAGLTALAFLVFVLMVLMVAQVGSYELACRGHNDLIRHWECR